jgi:hypothetical protein
VAASPNLSIDASGRRVTTQGPTAADAIAHVKARFADLQAEVLQRQAIELLSLVARVALSR